MKQIQMIDRGVKVDPQSYEEWQHLLLERHGIEEVRVSFIFFAAIMAKSGEWPLQYHQIAQIEAARKILKETSK